MVTKLDIPHYELEAAETLQEIKNMLINVIAEQSSEESNDEESYISETGINGKGWGIPCVRNATCDEIHNPVCWTNCPANTIECGAMCLPSSHNCHDYQYLNNEVDNLTNYAVNEATALIDIAQQVNMYASCQNDFGTI